MSPIPRLAEAIREGITTSAANLQLLVNTIEDVVTQVLREVRNDSLAALHTAHYLEWAVSSRLVGAARAAGNEAAIESSVAVGLSAAFNDQANLADFSLGASTDRRNRLAVLASLYRMHAYVALAAQRAGAPLTAHPVELLRGMVQATFAPWQTAMIDNRWNGDDVDVRVRVVERGGVVALELAVAPNQARSAPEVPLYTWNMQGGSLGYAEKWARVRDGMLRASGGRPAAQIVALQEAGGTMPSYQEPAPGVGDNDVYPLNQRTQIEPRPLVDPATGQIPEARIWRWRVRDQFGEDRHVEEYRWSIGSAGRTRQDHRIFHYNVGRLRVNLAIIIPEDWADRVTPVIIADGEGQNRPLLGLRIMRDPADPRGQDITVYSFHAVSGGGPNAPHMLREVAAHTATPFVVAGDFNREPRQGAAPATSWLFPSEVGSAIPSDRPTHNNNFLDYAVASTSRDPGATGITLDRGDSDHGPVFYLLALLLFLREWTPQSS
ncbi:MAG: hypothetical protein ACRC20_14040 [Segniliparus sp.]|uniref:hypothetical protein n=1 Tax=Segniliparus sp. TaxID=2804064 RepID=UPI003F32B233